MPPFPPVGVILGSWVAAFSGIAIVMGLQAHIAQFAKYQGHNVEQQNMSHHWVGRYRQSIICCVCGMD
jgi:hypothetical protein